MVWLLGPRGSCRLAREYWAQGQRSKPLGAEFIFTGVVPIYLL